MFLKRVIDKIHRFYIEKSANDVKINYYRKRGMKIGEDCLIGGKLSYTNEAYLIEIGDHVGIADDALFITHDAGLWCFSKEYQEDDMFGKIIIGNNVLVGMKCIFLPNTQIGNNCMIGAGSVVRGKFPDNSVIFGNPAKVISKMSVLKLLYDKNPNRLKTAKMSDKDKEPIVKKHFGIE